MDTIFVERDPHYLQRIWLSPSTGQRVSIGPADRSQQDWAGALCSAAAELGLRAGQPVAIASSDPALHALPWEYLGGTEGQVSVVRQIPAPDAQGTLGVPQPLRLLVALDDDSLLAPLRTALDGWQRQGVLSLTLAGAGHVGTYLDSPGYYHVVHVSSDAPCLASARILRRQCGQGKLPLLVIHGGADPALGPVLVTGQVTAALVLSCPLDGARASQFLAEVYGSLLSGASLAQAVASARAGLAPAQRLGVLLFTARPDGDIWPAPVRSSVQARLPGTPVASAQGQGPKGEAAAGLFVGGNVNVSGDLVAGTKTQTVQQVGGDMVAITRQSAVPHRERLAPRFCPACGTPAEAGHTFCQACGRQLDDY